MVISIIAVLLKCAKNGQEVLKLQLLTHNLLCWI